MSTSVKTETRATVSSRVRFRLQNRLMEEPWLVLQLEESHEIREYDGWYNRWNSWVPAPSTWRDAQLEDLSVMDIKNLAFQSQEGEMPVCFKPRRTWGSSNWLLVLRVLDGGYQSNVWRDARLEDLRFKEGKILGGIGIVTG